MTKAIVCGIGYLHIDDIVNETSHD